MRIRHSKGAFADVKERGLGAFQASVGALVPFEAERAKEISDWAQVALLTVKVDRLDTWARAGLVCIGDAAHAMSPIGGVGVNLAVQDAVAAANLLARPLREGRLSLDDLNRVQARREFPARVTQGLQLFLQKTVIKRALSAEAPMTPPLPMRALLAVPYLNRIPARLIGLGVRPEHVSAEIRAGRG